MPSLTGINALSSFTAVMNTILVTATVMCWYRKNHLSGPERCRAR